MPRRTPLVQPVNVSQREQGRQTLVTALTEVDELKASLKHVEMCLVKSKEEKERMRDEINE